MAISSKQRILLAASASEDKKGINPVLLDVRKVTDIADYFLIVNGNSDRHVKTIADAVIERLGTKKVHPAHVEGMSEGTWVLVDYGDVIVHVFHYQTRQFYNLERLWGDAKEVKASVTHSNHENKTKRTRR